jgi:branched-chain amino acid transport system permease protein
MEILAGSLASGLLIGLVFALIALGLTIIFGMMDIVNFAHGEFLMLGMYTTLFASQGFGIDPLFTIPIAAAVGMTLGIACYAGFVRFLLRGPMVAQLLGTFGLMLLLRNAALLAFGSEDRTISSGLLVDWVFDLGTGIIFPATKLAAALFSILAFSAVWLLMNRTRTGNAMLATALNAQGARYMGIPTERMNALAWGIGGATVCVAGSLLVNFWSVTPYSGLLFTMIAFATVALGGFGSVPGALVAGLIIGMITEIPGFWDFFSQLTGSRWMGGVSLTPLKYTCVYLAYFLIMLVRPRGLFGWKR